MSGGREKKAVALIEAFLRSLRSNRTGHTHSTLGSSTRAWYPSNTRLIPYAFAYSRALLSDEGLSRAAMASSTTSGWTETGEKIERGLWGQYRQWDRLSFHTREKVRERSEKKRTRCWRRSIRRDGEHLRSS